MFVCFASYQGRAIHVPLAIRNGNRELVLIENWLPVVQFLETVSPPACRSWLSVHAIALQSADFRGGKERCSLEREYAHLCMLTLS